MSDGELSGRTVGKFVLRELLGVGGHGVVYRGEQGVLKRDVAVKVLRAHHRGCRETQERFLREARLASALVHPYAAHVYAFDIEHDGLMWIAMERVHGSDLHAWLLKHGPMAPKQFVPFFGRVAQVVYDAHMLGIVHRDLKPSNVMVIEKDGDQYPKLLDYGIAKAPPGMEMIEVDRNAIEQPAQPLLQCFRHDSEASSGTFRTPTITPPLPSLPPLPLPSPAPGGTDDNALTRPGARLGSHAYMSPEQWHSPSTVGPASDIYALGVLAFRMLVGVEPFVGIDAGDYYQMHTSAEVPPLPAGDFASRFERVVRRALAKNPAQRYTTALEMANDFAAAMRTSERAQLQVAAQQWEDRRRSPGFLWGRKVVDLEAWAARMRTGDLSPLESSFVATSWRRVRRSVWLRRALGVFVVLLMLGGVQYRATWQARIAEDRAAQRTRLAEATVTQAELEQGRSAQLLGEPDAAVHLARAYRREPSAATAFMLARALQPRLAELATLPAATGRMWAAAFSPNGRQIVATDDRGARLFDASTFRLLHELPHGNEVYDAVFSKDGQQLVTVATDAVRVWSTSTGALMKTLVARRADGLPPDYFVVAASPQDRLIAAADASGSEVHVWDASTGTCLALLRGDGSDYPGIAFSADARWLAVTGGNEVRVFDARTWKRVATIRGPRIRQIAFAPTGSRILTGAATGDVAIWDAPAGRRLLHLREVGDPIDAVAYSPNGALVVAAMRDGSEQIWNANAGSPVSLIKARHSKIRALEFDQSSKLIVSAGTDGVVVVANVELAMPVAVLEGARGIMWTARFDTIGERVIGASWDGNARVWSTSPPYRRASAPAVSDDCGVVTTPEPDRRYIAVGCRDQPVRVWDTARSVLLAELPAPPRPATGAALPEVSMDGTVAAIARGANVDIYALLGGRLMRTITRRAVVTVMSFASNGQDLVVGDRDGGLMVARDGGALIELPAVGAAIDVAACLPDGRLIAVDANRRLQVYDRGGSMLAELEVPTRLMALRVDFDRVVGIPVYTGNAAAPVLIDVAHYRLVASLTGHVGRVFSARWVDGYQVLTAGGDGTVRLWDGLTGALLRVFEGGTRSYSDAAITNDGFVVAGGAAGLVRFWDRETGRPLWTFQAHPSQVVGLHIEGADLVTRGIAGEVTRWTLPSPSTVIRTCEARDGCAIVLHNEESKEKANTYIGNGSSSR